MIIVKKVGEESIPAIQELAEMTWAIAYAAILPPQQMAYMLDLFYSTTALQKQMQGGDRFILATDNNEPVGFASYSPKECHTELVEVLSKVYRLHKIYIDPNQQGKGIGRALVADLEERVRECGGLTITLGTDDVSDQTSLSGINLYPHIWEHLANIKNLKRHPYEFYQKQGYVIVGLMPDANGPGKPDILMAKSVVR